MVITDQTYPIWNIADHRNRAVHISGLKATGIIIIIPMPISRELVTGKAQDKDSHMLQVTGIRINMENPGQKVTGKRIRTGMVNSIIISVTIKMTAAIAS